MVALLSDMRRCAARNSGPIVKQRNAVLKYIGCYCLWEWSGFRKIALYYKQSHHFLTSTIVNSPMLIDGPSATLVTKRLWLSLGELGWIKSFKSKAPSTGNSRAIAKIGNAGVETFGLKTAGHDLIRGPWINSDMNIFAFNQQNIN